MDSGFLMVCRQGYVNIKQAAYWKRSERDQHAVLTQRKLPKQHVEYHLGNFTSHELWWLFWRLGLKFQRQAGVESSTWDRAFVSSKSIRKLGQCVVQFGTVSDSVFTSQTITISNYVTSIPIFQVRFGIGRTDSSVQYSGWNVDDVEIIPKASESQPAKAIGHRNRLVQVLPWAANPLPTD